MSTLLLGIFAMAGLLGLSLAQVEARIFLNFHSILLVLGGSLAVLFTANPWRQLFSLGSGLVGLVRPETPREKISQSLIEFARGNRDRTLANHTLLERAIGLWEQGVDPELFETLLHQSLEELNQSLEHAVTALRNLSKYPPALGMTGTVMGLVTLFSQLTPDKNGNMGSSLALAMTATFYGLVLANAVILPLADRLGVQQMAQTQFNDYLFRSLILIHRGEATSLIEEKVHGYAA